MQCLSNINSDSVNIDKNNSIRVVDKALPLLVEFVNLIKTN